MAGPWEAYRGAGASGAPREIRGAGYEDAQKKRAADLQAQADARVRAAAANKRAEDAAGRAASLFEKAEEDRKFGVVPAGFRRTRDGSGRIEPIPGFGQSPQKPYNENRVMELKSALKEIDKAEKLAREGFLTVGRPAEIITGLPIIGPLLDQDRVDFIAQNQAVVSTIMEALKKEIRENVKTGVSGEFNVLQEQQAAAAAKSQLDPSQSKKQYLEQTPRAKAYLNRLIDSELAKLGDKYPDRQPFASSSQKVTVPLPDGRVASFPDQQSANAFKRKAGIR
jgi:hypothetical protein